MDLHRSRPFDGPLRGLLFLAPVVVIVWAAVAGVAFLLAR